MQGLTLPPMPIVAPSRCAGITNPTAAEMREWDGSPISFLRKTEPTPACRSANPWVGAARDHERRCAYPGVCRSAHRRGSARSSLKMKCCDPSHSRISAVAGVVMPAHLEGVTIDIGGKVRPCTPLVDQF